MAKFNALEGYEKILNKNVSQIVKNGKEELIFNRYINSVGKILAIGYNEQIVINLSQYINKYYTKDLEDYFISKLKEIFDKLTSDKDINEVVNKLYNSLNNDNNNNVDFKINLYKQATVSLANLLDELGMGDDDNEILNHLLSTYYDLKLELGNLNDEELIELLDELDKLVDSEINALSMNESYEKIISLSDNNHIENEDININQDINETEDTDNLAVSLLNDDNNNDDIETEEADFLVTEDIELDDLDESIDEAVDKLNLAEIEQNNYNLEENDEFDDEINDNNKSNDIDFSFIEEDSNSQDLLEEDSQSDIESIDNNTFSFVEEDSNSHDLLEEEDDSQNNIESIDDNIFSFEENNSNSHDLLKNDSQNDIESTDDNTFSFEEKDSNSHDLLEDNNQDYIDSTDDNTFSFEEDNSTSQDIIEDEKFYEYNDNDSENQKQLDFSILDSTDDSFYDTLTLENDSNENDDDDFSFDFDEDYNEDENTIYVNKTESDDTKQEVIDYDLNDEHENDNNVHISDINELLNYDNDYNHNNEYSQQIDDEFEDIIATDSTQAHQIVDDEDGVISEEIGTVEDIEVNEIPLEEVNEEDFDDSVQDIDSFIENEDEKESKTKASSSKDSKSNDNDNDKGYREKLTEFLGLK